MTERRGDWMQTFTGVQFWPVDPRPEDVRIEDIAHSLSNQCRFAGHCTSFYSVAQHSVLVSQIVPPEFAPWGLLHDAAEAYLVDLPRPIKRFSPIGEQYQQIESALMDVICRRFGLHAQCPVCVKWADDRVLMTEKRDLMPNSPAKWSEVAQPMHERITPLDPLEAKIQFVFRAAELGLMRCTA